MKEEKACFFSTFAQMWCESYDQKHLCNSLKNDVHSVSMFRVDKTLRNIKAFRDTFQCNDGDKMARTDEEICDLWE